MNPISKGLSWKFQKNRQFIDDIVLRNAPEFVYKSDPLPLKGEIPVFTFHAALPDWFEEQCLHLAENGYQTLTAGEFLKAMTSPGPNVRKSVLLTFDDGLKHIWTVAYPLLKKYNLKATCFILPGCITENDNRIRPTLEDYWKSQTTIEEIISLSGVNEALATWEEIKIMHESGVIDFQSHTMYHSLVSTSDRIFDFMNPDYNTHFFGNIHVPFYSINGKDNLSREPLMGMPIYWAKPRMSASRRFFDDEDIRNRCVEVVRKEGLEIFFKQKNWRRVLHKVVSDYRRIEDVKERYETPEERDKSIFEDLYRSKQIIEKKLKGKKVIHLCYPWFEAQDFTVKASKKAGFKVNYFGNIKGKPTNRLGDDPFRIVRIDEIYLQRLPGKGRIKIRDIFSKFLDMRKLPKLFGLSKT